MAQLQRSLAAQVRNAMAAMACAEHSLAANPTAATRLAYVQAKTAVSHQLDEQFVTKSAASKKRWYNAAERPSRVVSAALRKTELRRAVVAAVMSDDDVLHTEPTEIAAAFASFLTSLFAAKPRATRHNRLFSCRSCLADYLLHNVKSLLLPSACLNSML
jgi:hypothetical protein